MKKRAQQTTKVIITDAISPEAIHLLNKQGYVVNYVPNISRAKLLEVISGYDVLICRTNTKVNKQLLDAAARLRCIGLASTGYDQIDVQEATKRNISIVGLPSHNKDIDPIKSGNFISTAEHTMLLILASLGDFYQASRSLKEGRWEKHLFLGREAYGKTLGIIGFGRIGRLVAHRAKAFGMHVIAYDPYVSRKEMRLHGATAKSLERLCSAADIITIHAPKTSETIDLLDGRLFKLMKKGVILINAARSEIINKNALIQALKKGIVHRIAVDVFKDEPHGVEWDLITIDEVIPTPHIAGSTHEALNRISIETAKSVIDLLKKRRSPNIINKQQ